MSMSLNAAKAILADAGKDCDAARTRLEGANAIIAEAKTKLRTVMGAGFSLAEIGAAINALEAAQKDLQACGARIGAAGQHASRASSG